MAKKHFSIIVFTQQVFHGKTLWRILFNLQVQKYCTEISGTALDLASGGYSSYMKYLPPNIELMRTDLSPKDGVAAQADFNKPLPFCDNRFDAVLFFNALYIAEDRVATLQEIHRVLKKGGVLYLSTPFIFPEISEPVDYCRLTYQGLEKETREAGFSDIEIVRFGERFTSAANLLHPFFLFDTVRFVIYGASLLFDKIIPRNIVRRHPAPMGYFCVLRKSDI